MALKLPCGVFLCNRRPCTLAIHRRYAENLLPTNSGSEDRADAFRGGMSLDPTHNLVSLVVLTLGQAEGLPLGDQCFLSWRSAHTDVNIALGLPLALEGICSAEALPCPPWCSQAGDSLEVSVLDKQQSTSSINTGEYLKCI